MARATKWTDEKIKASRPANGKSERRVLVAPGLYLHLRRKAGGDVSRHWQYRVQVDGKRRWLAVGEYPAVSLADAQAQLLKHAKVHEAAKRGEADHPVLVERSSRKANKAQPSVAEVFAEWIADKRLGSTRKRGVPVRERTIAILTENFDADVRARIGDAKIAHITPAALQDCIDAARRRGAPGAAAHVYRTLRGLVTFAVKRGYITAADPMRGIENPRPYRPQPPNAANDAEIIALLHLLDQSRVWPATRLAIEFQLLTGARPGEVRLAEWHDIQQDRSAWTIPAERFKSGRAFKINLSNAALAVLKNAKALRPANEQKSTDFVFPGANGGPMEKMAVARALSRLAERAKNDGAKRLRPHDLRKTFRTLLSRIGIAPHVAELCLGHVERETMRRVYDGHDYSHECADAWERAGAHIASLRAGAAQVVVLRRKLAA